MPKRYQSGTRALYQSGNWYCQLQILCEYVILIVGSVQVPAPTEMELFSDKLIKHKKAWIITGAVYAAALLGLIITFTFIDKPFSETVYSGGTAFNKIFDVLGNMSVFLIFTVLFGFLSVYFFYRESATEKTIENTDEFIKNSKPVIPFPGEDGCEPDAAGTGPRAGPNKNHCRKRFLLAICLTASCVSAALAMMKAFSDMPGKMFISAAAALALPAACFFIAWKVHEKGPETLKRLCYALIISGIMIALSAIVVYSVKFFWGRARYFAVIGDGLPYSPWYSPQGKPTMDDKWASFPSGHTMSACAFAALPLCAIALNANKWVKLLCGAGCFALILCTMLSRVFMGMHYMTDTLFSLLICSAALVAAIVITDKIYGSSQ